MSSKRVMKQARRHITWLRALIVTNARGYGVHYSSPSLRRHEATPQLLSHEPGGRKLSTQQRHCHEPDETQVSHHNFCQTMFR